MAKSLIIGNINPVGFARRDNKLPSYENTLEHELDFEGVVRGSYIQQFIKDEAIKIQFRSDHDTLTATLVTCDGVTANIPVIKIKTFTEYSFYEISISTGVEDTYFINIKGATIGELTNYERSEYFQTVEGIQGFRSNEDTSEGYKYILHHLLIECSNIENDFNTFFEEDDFGNKFVSRFWIPTPLYKIQSEGETEVYNNLGNLTKLSETFQNSFEMITSAVPRHLAMKIQETAGLDNFFINDIQYISLEKGEIEYFGNYTSVVLTMNLTQRFAIGLNSDDRGFESITTDMSGIDIKQASGVSGSGNFQILAGYMINSSTIQLVTGSNGTVRIGSTVGDDDILMQYPLSAANPHDTPTTYYSHPTDVSYTVYWETSGVGATFNIIVQAIINKQV